MVAVVGAGGTRPSFVGGGGEVATQSLQGTPTIGKKTQYIQQIIQIFCDAFQEKYFHNHRNTNVFFGLVVMVNHITNRIKLFIGFI